MESPSGEINNIPLLKKIALQNQPTILSTGMCTLGEIELALKTLYENNLKKKITVPLQFCISNTNGRCKFKSNKNNKRMF